MSGSSAMSTSKKLAIVLAVSLGLNLFLLGVLSVGFFRGPRPGHFGGPGPDASPLLRGGPGGDHPRLQKLLGRHKPELVEQRRSMRAARGRVDAALEAEPFDRARLEAELAKLRTETQRSQETMHRALVELAVDMPPEERKRLPMMLGGRHGSGERRDGGRER